MIINWRREDHESNLKHLGLRVLHNMMHYSDATKSTIISSSFVFLFQQTTIYTSKLNVVYKEIEKIY